MPVEIRELVIQARLKEDEAPAKGNKSKGLSAFEAEEEEEDDDDDEEGASNAQSPEWIEQVVDQCIVRLQEWLTEKSIR